MDRSSRPGQESTLPSSLEQCFQHARGRDQEELVLILRSKVEEQVERSVSRVM